MMGHLLLIVSLLLLFLLLFLFCFLVSLLQCSGLPPGPIILIILGLSLWLGPPVEHLSIEFSVVDGWIIKK